tara:strand:- start:477 stop:632 length:156 start_codon:yes stop_codon:yes gene_type:complete
LTLEELQAEMDRLPSQHPEFLIGWLMSQVVHLVNKEKVKEDEEKKPILEVS